VLRAYEEYEDIPGNAVIKVYSLKEIAAEKVIAVCDRARNEPRDLYDLWYLCEQAHVDLTEVTDPIADPRWLLVRFGSIIERHSRPEAAQVSSGIESSCKRVLRHTK
jgi:predicted nucleotidyltransferase component of viral defense system